MMLTAIAIAALLTSQPAGRGAGSATAGAVVLLDFQALTAILQWHFEPARDDGKVVPAVVEIELTFTLK